MEHPIDSIVEMEKHILHLLAENNYSARDSMTTCLSSAMFILSAEIDSKSNQIERINTLVSDLLPIINNFVEYCAMVNIKVSKNEPLLDNTNY